MADVKSGKLKGPADVKMEAANKTSFNVNAIMADETEPAKRDSLSRYNYNEGVEEAQDAYSKNVLNPEKNDNIKKTKFVADSFVTMAKENLPLPQKNTKKGKKLNTISSITCLISKPPVIKDDANIDRLIQTIQASKRSPQQLATFLGINVKVIRLIQHQAGKPTNKNDVLPQPFCWVRPKMKDYTLWLKTQDEFLIKRCIIDQLPAHRQMSYENRIDQISKGGLKLNYPKLKFIYKKLGISSEQYKEPANEYQKRENFWKQFEQLIALEMANIKMRGQKLVYLDLVKVSLTELQLVLSPIAPNELEEPDETYQSIYA